jgi:hypothetical protein
VLERGERKNSAYLGNAASGVGDLGPSPMIGGIIAMCGGLMLYSGSGVATRAGLVIFVRRFLPKVKGFDQVGVTEMAPM